MRLKTLLRVSLSVAALLVIITLATPFLVKSELKKQLLQLGAEEAGIESLYLNIWTGYLHLQGLQASASGEPSLALGELEANVRYLDLWKQRFHLNALSIKGLTLPVSVGDQLKIGPLLIPSNSEETSSEAESKPWDWGLTLIELADLKIAARYQQQLYQLDVDQGRLQLLQHWLPDQNSQLLLKGSLNKSPFDIDSRGTPLAASAAGALSLKVDKLDLAPLLKPWAPELAGILSADLTLDLNSNGTRFSIQQKGTLKLQQLAYQQDQLALKADSIRWSGALANRLEAGKLTQVDTDGSLALQGLSVKQDQLTLQQKALDWQGSQQISFSEQFPSLIKSTGKLGLTGLNFSQEQLKLAGDIHWQGNNQLSFSDQTPSQLINEGQLQLAGLNLQQPGLALQNTELKWDGKISTDTKTQISAAGTLEDQNLSLQLKGLDIKAAASQWQGSSDFDLDQATLTSLSGDAELSDIAINGQHDSLLSLEKVSAKQLSAGSAANQVKIGQLILSNLLLNNKTPLLTLAEANLQQLETGPVQTRIDSLQLGQLDTELLLNKEGQPAAWSQWVAQISGTNSSTPAATEPSTESADDSASYSFALKQLSLAQPSKIRFRDESVNARDIEINISQLSLNDIDSQSQAPGDFAIAAKINRFGELTVDGNYAWMNPDPNGQWQGSLKNLELPPFSPYMQRYSGYQLRSGQFALTTGGTIKAGQVDSKNKVNIHNLQVKKASSEDTAEFDKQLGMPLETALSIITDDDNNVTLDVPVKGSLADPEFGYQSVINIVMGKIAKEGAISYLTASLQPYGALISLGRMMMDSASKNAINLEPVTFAPGSAELQPKSQDYINKISDLLKEKEALRLNLCGIAVAADRDALIAAQTPPAPEGIEPEATEATPPAVTPVIDEALLQRQLTELAENRSDTVKQRLQEQGQIKAERLFICLPEVDLQTDKAPAVNMGL